MVNESIGTILNAIGGGMTAVLQALLKFRFTTVAPTDDTFEDYLHQAWKDPEGNTVQGYVRRNDDNTADTTAKGPQTVVKYTRGNRDYYVTDLGMLTQTLYNLFSTKDTTEVTATKKYSYNVTGHMNTQEGHYVVDSVQAVQAKDSDNKPLYTKGALFLEWLMNGQNINIATSGDHANQSQEYVVNLKLPVNRLMAFATKSSYIFTGAKVRRGFHLNIDPGDTLVVLMRWIMDDGFVYKIKPLLDGIITPGEDGTTILDTIIPLLDGQADNIMGILIALLNTYNVGYINYTDTVMTGTFAREVDGEMVPYINHVGSNYESPFVLGQYLEESLSDFRNYEDAEGHTLTSMEGKADLAIANADKLIASMVPTVVNMLGDTINNLIKDLAKNDAEWVGDILESVASGDQDYDELGEIISHLLLNNNFIDLVMGIVFGNEDREGLMSSLLVGDDGKMNSTIELLL